MCVLEYNKIISNLLFSNIYIFLNSQRVIVGQKL